MIILNNSTSLEIVLSSAITTNELDITVNYGDLSADGRVITEVNQRTLITNGTTPVTALDIADSFGKIRKVTFVTIMNVDTDFATVTIQKNDNSNIREQYVATIAPDEAIQYMSGVGFFVTNIDRAPYFDSIELGHASDTTLTRDSAGRLAVEGSTVVYNNEVRELLNADIQFYVRPDGDDGNSGGADDPGSAFLTIQKAVDTVAMYDLSIYDAYINIADGTYIDPITIKTLVGAGTCTIRGNLVTPANVLISTGSSNAIAGVASGNYHLEGVKIETTNRAAINVAGSVYFTFNDIDLGATGLSFHLRADGNAILQALGDYEITGGADRHYVVTNGGRILLFAVMTVTLTGTPAFSSTFADATLLSTININSSNVTFSGAATGQRYNVTQNSLIHTNSGGATFLPGDVAGVDATGGQYT